MERVRLGTDLDVFCLNTTEARLLYQDIFEDRCYLKGGISIRDGDCVFDVGANIGLFALFLLREARELSIFSFEPIPPIFDVLQANFAGQAANLHPLNLALSRAAGTASFTFYPANSALSGAYANPKEDENLARAVLHNKYPHLPARMLDGLMAKKFEGQTFACRLDTFSNVRRRLKVDRINLLKIDVEKAEQDVLDGIEPTDWERIEQVVAEVHDVDGRLGRLLQLLHSHGFRATVEQEAGFRGTALFDVFATRRRRSER